MATAAAASAQKFAIIYDAVSARRNFFFLTLSNTDNYFLQAKYFIANADCAFHIICVQLNSNAFVVIRILCQNIQFLLSRKREIQSLIILDFYRVVGRDSTTDTAASYLLRAPRASTLQSDVIELAPCIIVF